VNREERGGLFILFPSPQSLSSKRRGSDMRRMQIEEMQLSEEFVEQFSEILLKEF
jgi:hypothetical protein